jgi:hypothetical protein
MRGWVIGKSCCRSTAGCRHSCLPGRRYKERAPQIFFFMSTGKKAGHTVAKIVLALGGVAPIILITALNHPIRYKAMQTSLTKF